MLLLLLQPSIIVPGQRGYCCRMKVGEGLKEAGSNGAGREPMEGVRLSRASHSAVGVRVDNVSK